MRTTAASAGRPVQPDLPARQGRAVSVVNAVLWDRAAQRARPVPPDPPVGLPAPRGPPDPAEQQAPQGRQDPVAPPPRVEQLKHWFIHNCN